MNNVTTEKPITKTAFVKSLPDDMAGKEVVERARAIGIDLSEAYVYEIRSKLKRSGKGRLVGGTSDVVPIEDGLAVRAKAGPPPNKRDFVESLPTTMPVSEVIAEAAKQGMSVSPTYIYALRGAKKTRTSDVSSPTSSSRAFASPEASSAQRRLYPPVDSIESRFIGLALEVGLARATDLLESVRLKVKDLVPTT